MVGSQSATFHGGILRILGRNRRNFGSFIRAYTLDATRVLQSSICPPYKSHLPHTTHNSALLRPGHMESAGGRLACASYPRRK